MTPGSDSRSRRADDGYRPSPTVGMRVSGVRDMTLGEVAEAARRHRHFVATVLVVLVVTVWFPGEGPVTERFNPAATDDGVSRLASGGARAASGSSGDEAAAGDFDPAASGAALLAGGAGGAGDGGGAGDDGFDFGFDVPDGSDSGDGGGSGADDDPEGGDGSLSCRSDDELPEPVVAPTVDEARTAQQGFEEQTGEELPVDAATNLAVLAGCRASAASAVTAAGLDAGSVLPREAPLLALFRWLAFPLPGHSSMDARGHSGQEARVDVDQDPAVSTGSRPRATSTSTPGPTVP